MALIGLEMGQFSMQNACEIEWKPCFFVVKRADFDGFQFGGGIEGKACAAWRLAAIGCESEAGLIFGEAGETMLNSARAVLHDRSSSLSEEHSQTLVSDPADLRLPA